MSRILNLIERPSPNFERRTEPVELVVLHYTGMQDAETALRRLTDPAPLAGAYPGPWADPDLDPNTALGRVSAHYVVDEKGQIHRLVPESEIAWHAGKSVWAGREGVNARSIGIEIVNGGHDFDLPAFPVVQIAATIALIEDLLGRFDLTPDKVVGHSDVAPGRKLDPGERFPWRALAHAGVSIWPSGDPPRARDRALAPGDQNADVENLQEALAAFGYGIGRTGLYDAQTETIIRAFQRRFRPSSLTGAADEETLAILADLLEQIVRLTLRRLRV